MIKQEKTRDNSNILKIVIIILFLAFFVLGIAQCVNDSIKTTYAENEITENVEVNNKIINKKVNNAINYQYVGTENGIIPNTNGSVINGLYFNSALTNGQMIDIIDSITEFSSESNYLKFYIIFATTDGISYDIGKTRSSVDDSFIYAFSMTLGGDSSPFWDSENGWNPVVIENGLTPTFNQIMGGSFTLVNPYLNYSVGMQNNLLKDLISTEPFVPYTPSGGGGITPNDRFDNPLFTIPNGYEKITQINLDIDPNNTTNNVAEVVVCGKLDFDTENNDYYYDLFYGFACGGEKKEYEVDKATRLTNGINDLFLEDRFLIQINISEQNSITFNLSYLQENTTKLNINEDMLCNSSYASNNLFRSNGFNSMLLTRNYIKTYYNDIGFENGRIYGYEQGLNDGNVEGYNQGYQVGKTDGYAEGDTAGYDRGYAEGDTAGYDRGYAEGDTAGYNEGYNVGNQIGLENGYNNGFNDGQKDEIGKNGFQKVFNSILNAPYNIFNGILNFELFGVNLFNLFSFIFTTILIVFIVRILIKR